jgi:isocitrate/isopropylmalate dehydrogenase
MLEGPGAAPFPVHQANVVRATDGLFLETAREVARDFPDVPMDDANVDAITMRLLKNPGQYDVLVAPNPYGDIVSEGRVRTGDMGGHDGTLDMARAIDRITMPSATA